jgi:hypothetical protein
VKQKLTMHRFATAVAVALVLFVAAVPAAAACCGVNPGGKMAAMHSSMSCCAESCRLTTANTNRDRDMTVGSTPPVSKPLPVVVAIAAPTSPSIASTFNSERTANEASAPRAFLIHQQFRI